MAMQFRNHPLRSAGILRTLALLLLPLAACSKGDESDASGQAESTASSEDAAPVLLLAIDGLEWSVMKALLARNELPNFARLMKDGQYGYLESMQPTFSPVIWTSVATGKQPQKHGILHFVYPKRIDAEVEMTYYTSGHRRTKAFWNILSDFGRTVHCFGWWMTFPAEPIQGMMVSQTNTTGVLHNPKKALWKGTLLKGVEGQVHPPEKQNSVMERLEQIDRDLPQLTESIFGRFPAPLTKLTDYLWSQTHWAFRADAVYLETALNVLDEGEDFDLMALYLGGADVSAHRFWRFAYPLEFAHKPRQPQVDNFGDVINDYYRYVDTAIGSLLERADRELNVVIVSDHGMHAFNTEHTFRASDPPEMTNSGQHLDAPPGVFLAAGPQVRRTTQPVSAIGDLDLNQLPTVGGVLDVLPTLLSMLAIPIAEDFDGQTLTAVLDPNWLLAHPQQSLSSHDDEDWLAAREGRQANAVDESDRLDQLRELGYID